MNPFKWLKQSTQGGQSVNTSTQFCDNCGGENRAQAKFCSFCRASLQDPLQSLQQRYSIVGELGEGSFGKVHKAEDKRFGGKYCAIKEMSQNGLNTQQLQEAIRDFEREALLLSGLKHKNLPRIYDHFTENGRWYLVMDYLEGDTLTEFLKKRNGKLSVVDTLPIATQLCEVLEYLHKHQPPIIFRDLKPDNIIITHAGELYLIDFGIARFFKAGQTKDTIALGTAGYAAPEQHGKAQTTPASDIYSFGVTLHEILSGKDPSMNPFHFEPLNLGPHWQELEQLVMQMLDMNPSKRPSLDEIQATLHQMTTPQQPSSSNKYAIKLQKNRIANQSNAGNIGECILIYSEHSGPINAVTWSPDSRYIASGSTDKTVRVWEAKSGRELVVYIKHKAAVNAVAWSPDSLYIASADNDETVRIWDARTGKRICKYEAHNDYVNSLAWSPNNLYIASASDDETVKIWDINTGSTLLTYTGHESSFSEDENYVQTVAWSPDGLYIASADDDETVRVWEADTGTELFSYEKHSDDINAVAWSPDGLYIASASDDKTVRISYATTGKKVCKYEGKHTASVKAIAWSPNSTYIASAGDDETVRIWEATTGWDEFIYSDHEEGVHAIAWSPDGKLIASGSSDGTVHVWQAL